MLRVLAVRTRLIEPSTEQILRYCADEPVERVFLEDVARRGAGPLRRARGRDGELTALCHLGTQRRPLRRRAAGRSPTLAAKSGARMLIGESGAVTDLWEAARKKLPRPRLDRPGQPVYAIERAAPGRGTPGCAPATLGRPRPARPRVRGGAPRGARRRSPASRPERLPLAHPGADRGGPLVALGGGRRDPVQGRGVRVDAAAVQLQQVWVDPPARRQGFARPGAARPDPAAARRRRRPSASSCGRRTHRRSGCTSRSACTTCWTTVRAAVTRVLP